VLASRASVHASKPPARAAISGIVTAVPGPLRQRQPTSATKSAQSQRVPSRPSWISIGLAAIGAAIGPPHLGNVSAAASCQLRLDRHSNCGALLGHRARQIWVTSCRSTTLQPSDYPRNDAVCQERLRASAVRSVRKVGYSITSSARAISDGGTVWPSSFAVLRLIVSRNLVACSTGRSLGLAPRSILSTYSIARAPLQEPSWP